jgi:predicted metallopeptidase
MKSEGNVLFKNAISTTEFFSSSSRAGARALNVDGVLDETLDNAVVFEIELLLLQIAFEKIPNVQRKLMISIYNSFEFLRLLDVHEN